MFWLPHRHYKTIFQVSDQGSTSNVFQLLAMADLKEYSKHCCASLEGIKRQLKKGPKSTDRIFQWIISHTN